MCSCYFSESSFQLGYELDGRELDDVFWRFKAVAERKKVMHNERITQPKICILRYK